MSKQCSIECIGPEIVNPRRVVSAVLQLRAKIPNIVTKFCPRQRKHDGQEIGEWVMKTNKALKRLAKIEASLSALIERYATSEKVVQESLQDAKASVLRATKAVSLLSSPQTQSTASVKAGKSKRRHPRPNASRRISLATKKQKAVQSTHKAAGKTRKKSPPPVVKEVVRTKTARPAAKKHRVKAPLQAAKKAAAEAPAKQVTKKAAVIPPVRTVKEGIPAKLVTQTLAEGTKPIVERSHQPQPPNPAGPQRI
jgi:hypothetical protein